MQIAPSPYRPVFAEESLLVVLAKAARLNDAQAHQPARQIQVLRTPDDQFHQGEIVGIESEDVVLTSHRMEAGFPTGGKGVGDGRAQNVSVVAALGHEGAVAPGGEPDAFCDGLIDQFEQKVSVVGQFQRRSHTPQFGVVR